ncbi:hypothetical protein BVC71_09160 [Marivivens niveibacter]|uniref:Pilus assembly protein n=1 Tax=Marivivens niveibacter TaxID=1930667 RepID=A0A251WX84_9RHOB|nr:hypothetical protein [Marivivens niveibacter]OUD08881.1 hypothetical protein BVC71_09160 [Marivivens niveibacter]
MNKWLCSLFQDEDGAVTVDWVVLVAFLVGLGIAIVSSVGKQQTALGDNVTSGMSSIADKYY